MEEQLKNIYKLLKEQSIPEKDEDGSFTFLEALRRISESLESIANTLEEINGKMS